MKAVIITERELTHKYFKNPPTLETSRLILRKMLKSDCADMYEYASDNRVTEYLLWEPHPGKLYTYKYLAYLQSAYKAGKFFDWAVTCRSDGKMIGTCGFTSFDFASNSAEVGYVLNPCFWGMGIAPEALEAVINFGFITLDLHRIEAKYMLGNERSRKVMEKVGMTFEGVRRDSVFSRGKYASVGVCSIISDEYFSSRGGF